MVKISPHLWSADEKHRLNLPKLQYENQITAKAVRSNRSFPTGSFSLKLPHYTGKDYNRRGHTYYNLSPTTPPIIKGEFAMEGIPAYFQFRHKSSTFRTGGRKPSK